MELVLHHLVDVYRECFLFEYLGGRGRVGEEWEKGGGEGRMAGEGREEKGGRGRRKRRKELEKGIRGRGRRKRGKELEKEE